MSRPVVALIVVLVVAVALGALLLNLGINPSGQGNENQPSAENMAVTNGLVNKTNTGSVGNVPLGNGNVNSADDSPEILSDRVTVSIGRGGFSPKKVSLKAGGQVTWTNDDYIVHYVAPNDCPTHTKYRGVWDDDGAGRVEPGQTYTVTFSKAGKYSYHDHLDASVTGQVTVK